MQFLADVQLLCLACQGRRFKAEVLAVTHRGRSIADVLAMSVEETLAVFDPEADRDYVLRRALDPIARVGLGYLPLGQPLSTLSGGEAQRLKLARALSEQARGTLFVVDEPSAGLHAQDAAYVVEALRALVDEGASVVVVEHDLDVVGACDWVIDLGPGGGPHGGCLVAEAPEHVAKTHTRTGAALRISQEIGDRETGPASRSPDLLLIYLHCRSHAREHNLKDVSCSIPHGGICVVTGPSGSGKPACLDVVLAEGQRRFMETLTPYARQFLPTLPRPDVTRSPGSPVDRARAAHLGWRELDRRHQTRWRTTCASSTRRSASCTARMRHGRGPSERRWAFDRPRASRSG
jgi:excinuclease ABC subunit A